MGEYANQQQHLVCILSILLLNYDLNREQKIKPLMIFNQTGALFS
jgi:hypothetical protein